jgi:hypothetical protein
MKIFNRTGSLNPARSVFDLSHERKFDGDFGLLYPVFVEDCMPGDCFHIANEVVIRFHQPLFAPLLHECSVYVYYFFVPYRILWHDDYWFVGHEAKIQNPGSFERYIMGNEDGTEITGTPNDQGGQASTHAEKDLGGIYDFLYGVTRFGPLTGSDMLSGFPYYAYRRIWNEFFRDENLQDEVTDFASLPSYLHVNGILRRNWEKDYFTSALPNLQRGIMPALPTSSVVAQTVFDGALPFDFSVPGSSVYTNQLGSRIALSLNAVAGSSVSVTTSGPITGVPSTNPVNASLDATFKQWLNQNHIDVAGLFNIADLRLAFQLQKWLERNARGGVRYTEFLKSHFNVAPRDDRLDRPEYIGGTKAPVVFSEVLKTSEDGTDPQGHLAGHGLAASRDYVCKYHVQEFGCIIGLLSVMPRTAYFQGVDRQWKRRSRYEWPFPEFMHLSEQAVYEEEIMLHETSAGTNDDIFGYQGRYDEYRQRRSTIHGNLKDTLKFWHLARNFSTAVASRPVLNGQFISTADARKDIYPVPSQPGFIVNVGNVVKAVRPMPWIGEPGLIDHF